jgi:hypothetical protein
MTEQRKAAEPATAAEALRQLRECMTAPAADACAVRDGLASLEDSGSDPARVLQFLGAMRIYQKGMRVRFPRTRSGLLQEGFGHGAGIGWV